MEQQNFDEQAAQKVLNKDFENLIRKVGAGRTLTTAERALIEARASGSSKTTAYAKTIVELAEILGVTRRTVNIWKKMDGSPKPLPNGQHDVTAWREFVRLNGLKGGKDVAGANQEGLKARRLLVDIEERELRLAMKQGTVVSLESVRQEWITKVARARSLLESRFLNELPPILSGLDAHDIRQKLNRALHEAYEILHTE